MIRSWRDLMSVPFDSLGQFSKADLERFLLLLKHEIVQSQTDKGGDQLMVMASLMECRAEDDREAELIRRGLRLGLHVASLHRDAYYKAVQAMHRKKGQSTKAQNLESRNEQIIDTYNALRPTIGCLKARQEISDKHRLSLRMVTNILAVAGVYER